VYVTLAIPDAEVCVVVSRLPLGALAEEAAVALMVRVIAVRVDELVKNERLGGSVKVVVEESESMRGGNVTVSVPEPNVPAGMS
jgi:hypothetical protein